MVKFITMTVLLSIGLCPLRLSAETKLRKITPEAKALLENLLSIHNRGYMFGHHDDTVYGIGWDGVQGRSDVKDVCGDYPAVISFDLGHMEIGDSVNLDKVSFDKIREEAVRQYVRGGMVSVSWHVDNPLTGGSSWDISMPDVVSSILPEGELHAKFIGWIDRIADFLNSIRTPDGTKVPLLFRPWHENTDSWFWWGARFCSPEQYRKLWRMTAEELQNRGADHLLYAYGPSTAFTDSTSYMERYPGDDHVDLIGVDCYQFDRAEYMSVMRRSLGVLASVGRAHGKPIAVTETGYEAVPDACWWTHTLAEAVNGYPVAYVLVWRNARDRQNHFFAPYPGQVSADDFKKFYNNAATLFVGDVKGLLYNETSIKYYE